MTAAMQAPRLAVPGLIAALAIAIGIADWHSLVALVGLAAVACVVVSWLNHCYEHDSAEMRLAVMTILRSRAPAGSGPTPDGVPQPSSGDRVRVEARSAAPPLTPSALVGTAVPRPGVPTRPPAPTGTEWLPHGNSTTVPVGPSRWPS